MSGHILIDLDCTLAHYDGKKDFDHIGPPVPAMLARVKAWLASGCDVRIFTARACAPELIPAIEAWCLKYLGQKLPVTNRKGFDTITIYDDRAVQIQSNTGREVGAHERLLAAALEQALAGWRNESNVVSGTPPLDEDAAYQQCKEVLKAAREAGV